jgi:WD40 repeat protein
MSGCARTLAPLHHFLFSQRPTAIAWSQDSRRFAAADASGAVAVFDAASRREIARSEGYVPHRMPYVLSGLAFSPDGATLAFGGADGTVHVWDFRSSRTRSIAGVPAPLLAAAFSADGKRLALAGGGVQYEATGASPIVRPMQVVVIDISSAQPIATMQIPGMLHLVFAPDASAFFGTAAEIAEPVDGTLQLSGGSVLQVWRTQPIERIATHPGAGIGGSWSSDGRLFAMGSTVWDGRSGEVVCTTPFRIVSFADGDQSVLTVESGVGMLRDGPVAATQWVRPVYVRLRDRRRRDLGRYISGGQGRVDLASARISPDGRLAVDRRMYLWEIPR